MLVVSVAIKLVCILESKISISGAVFFFFFFFFKHHTKGYKN